MWKKQVWLAVLIGAALVAAVIAGGIRFRSVRKVPSAPPAPVSASESVAVSPLPDSVRMVILNGKGEAYKSGDDSEYLARPDFLYFASGDKVLFHMRVCRYVYFLVLPHGGDECRWKFVFLNEKSDWRDSLCDLKGDGDKRYLVIGTNDFGGTGRGSYDLHVIDVQDGFSEIFNFPGDIYEGAFNQGIFPVDVECCGRRKGEGFVFSFLNTVEYGGARGDVNLLVRLRFRNGREPEWAGERAGSIPVDRYHTEVKKVRLDDERGRELAFCQLYTELAEAGWIRHARVIAAKVGFTPEEIAKYDLQARRDLRNSYYKYLVEHNGVIF